MCGRGVAPLVSEGRPSGLSGIMPGMLASQLGVGLIRQVPLTARYNTTGFSVLFYRGARRLVIPKSKQASQNKQEETARTGSRSNIYESRAPRLLYSPQRRSHLIFLFPFSPEPTSLGTPLDIVPRPHSHTPVVLLDSPSKTSIAGTNARGKSTSLHSCLRSGRLRAYTAVPRYEEKGARGWKV